MRLNYNEKHWNIALLRFFGNEILEISIFTVPDCAQIDPSYINCMPLPIPSKTLSALLQDMCLN